VAGLRGLLEKAEKHEHSFTDFDKSLWKTKATNFIPRGILDIHNRLTVSA
jgi:hypothetical protein